MKKSILFFRLFCMYLLLAGNSLFSQSTITITLRVNTAEVRDPNPTAYCTFGQEVGISNEEFTVNARVGDTIIWQGVSSSSPDDIVNIVSINYEGGSNVFGENRLTGDGNEPEKVSGVILNNTVGKKDYKYKLSFTVFNNGEKRGGLFNIDPKIRVNN